MKMQSPWKFRGESSLSPHNWCCGQHLTWRSAALRLEARAVLNLLWNYLLHFSALASWLHPLNHTQPWWKAKIFWTLHQEPISLPRDLYRPPPNHVSKCPFWGQEVYHPWLKATNKGCHAPSTNRGSLPQLSEAKRARRGMKHRPCPWVRWSCLTFYQWHYIGILKGTAKKSTSEMLSIPEQRTERSNWLTTQFKKGRMVWKKNQSFGVRET